MKKAVLFLSLAALVAAVAAPASAQGGAQKFGWHLSAAVMPVPPYGAGDIAGSDSASKLIVNQPDCQDKLNITGVMNGLNPNTEYTVYLSKTYAPYQLANVAGNWTFNFELGGIYPHSVTLNQSGANVTGGGTYPVGGPQQYAWTIDSGQVSGNTFNFTAHYTVGADALSPLTVMNVSGNILSDGSLSGTWNDNYAGGYRTGSFTATGGSAEQQSGGAGWPGFVGSASAFTFTTDSLGAGSWHYNLSPIADFSVWINGVSGTILISDNVALKTDCDVSDGESILEVLKTKAQLLIERGVPGKGILNAPGLQKPFNSQSKAADHAGKKDKGDEGEESSQSFKAKSNNGRGRN